MKFGDVVTAVASLTVLYILLDSVLLLVLIPASPMWGGDAASIVSVLIASLIVGIVFAAKIQEESRRGAICRIVVLSTLVFTFVTMAFFANPYVNTAIQEGIESMFSTSGWTNTEWLAYSQMIMVMLVALNAVFALVFSFIGLYAGSMLRKPKKS